MYRINVHCLDEGSESVSVVCKEAFGSRQGLRLVLLFCLTLWGPRNEIKEKTLHFIRKTDLNTIQIIIFITKYKKKLQSFTKFGWFQTETAGTSKLFF